MKQDSVMILLREIQKTQEYIDVEITINYWAMLVFVSLSIYLARRDILDVLRKIKQ